jgi:hypothetical protein
MNYKEELNKWENNKISDGEFLDVLTECMKERNYTKTVELVCDTELCKATDAQLIEIILESICKFWNYKK